MRPARRKRAGGKAHGGERRRRAPDDRRREASRGDPLDALRVALPSGGAPDEEVD